MKVALNEMKTKIIICPKSIFDQNFENLSMSGPNVQVFESLTLN